MYDLAERPGGDVVDILPYQEQGDDLIVYAKDRYPRPIANIKPRMMSPSLDKKRWSGHMIEPLAAANTHGDTRQTIRTVLEERAGFDPAAIRLDESMRSSLHYYPAVATLNERVHAVRVRIEGNAEPSRPLNGHFSGFSNDGVYRPFEANTLLQAAQTGMLPGARLETGVYALMRERGKTPGDWLGQNITIESSALDILPRSLPELIKAQNAHAVFEPTNERSGWIDVKRSEFNEIANINGSEKAIAKQELEFIVPAKDTSTNSVMLICLARDDNSGEVLIGVQKINALQSQFAAVQNREGHSGLLSLPGLRLPSSIENTQEVPAYIAAQTGVNSHSVKKLGEGYFPSLGVMPDRIFPYVLTQPSEDMIEKCDFVPLRALYQDLDNLRDLHLISAVFRATHALGLWDDYAQTANLGTPEV